jgi:hypothetical protein
MRLGYVLGETEDEVEKEERKLRERRPLTFAKFWWGATS